MRFPTGEDNWGLSPSATSAEVAHRNIRESYTIAQPMRSVTASFDRTSVALTILALCLLLVLALVF